jgi:hypothetical protein
MLTIIWNPGGFHVVDILPKGFNASYYVAQILDPLSKWRRAQVGAEFNAEGTTSSILTRSGTL